MNPFQEIAQRLNNPRAVDYDGNPLERDETCMFCDYQEYPHEH